MKTELHLVGASLAGKIYISNSLVPGLLKLMITTGRAPATETSTTAIWFILRGKSSVSRKAPGRAQARLDID